MLAHIWELTEPVPSTKDEYVEMLKTRLLNGETLVHMDVDAILIEMAKPEPIHGWYMDDYDQDQDGVDSAEHGGTDCNDADAEINPNASERIF